MEGELESQKGQEKLWIDMRDDMPRHKVGVLCCAVLSTGQMVVFRLDTTESLLEIVSG